MALWAQYAASVKVHLLDDSVGDTFGSVDATYGVHISIAINAQNSRNRK
jgi:hypothetical protein